MELWSAITLSWAFAKKGGTAERIFRPFMVKAFLYTIEVFSRND